MQTSPKASNLKCSSVASLLKCSRKIRISGAIQGVYVQGPDYVYPAAVSQVSLAGYSYPAQGIDAEGRQSNLSLVEYVLSGGADPWTTYKLYIDPLPWFFVANSPCFYPSEFWGAYASRGVASKVKLTGPVSGTYIVYAPGIFETQISPTPWEHAFGMFALDFPDPWPSCADYGTPIACSYINLHPGETAELTCNPATITAENSSTPESRNFFRFNKHPEDFDWYPL